MASLQGFTLSQTSPIPLSSAASSARAERDTRSGRGRSYYPRCESSREDFADPVARGELAPPHSTKTHDQPSASNACLASYQPHRIALNRRARRRAAQHRPSGSGSEGINNIEQARGYREYVVELVESFLRLGRGASSSQVIVIHRQYRR